MSTTTDRVHFYERQYLRAFDLVAEQMYHLEMRRRLNLALHLWGIVDGFDVAKGALVPGAPEQFIVSPGMAIDGFGREIVSPAAYALSDEDLRRNRIQAAGDYWLSIAYRRELTTPPSPGYRLCDLPDQYTRWHESFTFVITDAKPAPTPPELTGTLSDDPSKHDWPVVLGKVRVGSSGGDLTIDDAWLEGRTYVGSRTERLVSPVASLPSVTGESRRPIRIAADGLAERNFAVGENFVVNAADVLTPPALPPKFPPEQGSLKVNTDLFVKREIYKFNSVTNKWATLTSNIRQFVPDVRVRNDVVIAFSTGAVVQPVSGIENVEIETILDNPTERQLSVSIAGVTGRGFTDLATWMGAIPAAEPWQLDVHFEAPATLVGTKKWRFPVRWTIGPMSTAALVPLASISIRLNCVAVFVP